MAEMNQAKPARVRRVRHRGRESQVLIYLGKQLRFFINQSDWKVLPMASIIAALVSMVIRNKIFVTMEGDLLGAFALTCVCIWNGCFNSIQAVCRERPIVKREHRSGLHISAYVTAHMIYQLALCAAQVGLTLYVLQTMGVVFPEKGIMTRYMVVDLAISMLLITYASDMLSLFLSSISHTTTGAMTLMPFVLIFQLVFSGGLIPLPEWSQALSDYTISSYGIRVLASQAGYNDLPMVTGWETLEKMRNNEIGGTVTLGNILDILDSPAVARRRDTEVMKSFTVGEAADILSEAEESLHLRDKKLFYPMTVGELMDILLEQKALDVLWDKPLAEGEDGTAVTVRDVIIRFRGDKDAQALTDLVIDKTITLGQVLDALHVADAAGLFSDTKINEAVTLGDIIDFANSNPALQAQRDREFTFKTTVGEIFELFGEENVKDIVERRTAAAAYKPEYASTEENIVGNWTMIGVFVIVFAVLSTIALELIDRDKR